MYSASNTFCDFANGRQGGDIIAFVAYVKGVNNWESMKLLSEHYSLSGTDERSREERRRMIQKQEREERKRAERQQAFHKALFGEIERLKRWECIYMLALEKSEIKPFSDLWAYIQNELQRISYRLDILCCADMGTYRRMKPNVELGLSSDRLQWLLDNLFKIVSVSEYHGLSRAGKPYTLNTLEIDYDGDKAKIKTFEGNAKPGDYAEICIGLKKSVYGAEIVAMVNKIIPAAEINSEKATISNNEEN